MKPSNSSAWRIGILFAFIAIAGSVSVSRPHLLTGNTFLQALMGPDLIAILVVALTITFASVANVHLAISRLVASAPNQKQAKVAAGRARHQLNSNAWTIFWAFLASLVALLAYGMTQNPTIKAAMITACLTVVLLNGLVMHDIYRSIFILVSLDQPNGRITGQQDFAQDSPPAGQD